MKLKTQPRQKLINLRKKLNLKQKDVANSIGITASYYGMIEIGVRNPSLDLAKKIAEFFGENMENIFFTSADNDTLSNSQNNTP